MRLVIMNFLATKSRLNAHSVDWFIDLVHLVLLCGEMQPVPFVLCWITVLNRVLQCAKIFTLWKSMLFRSIWLVHVFFLQALTLLSTGERKKKALKNIFLLWGGNTLKTKTLYYWKWYKAFKIGSWQESIYSVCNDFPVWQTAWAVEKAPSPLKGCMQTGCVATAVQGKQFLWERLQLPYPGWTNLTC